MNKKTKCILFVVMIAILITPLFGCKDTTSTAAPVASATVGETVSAAPNTDDATLAPINTDQITANPTDGEVVTAAPDESATPTPSMTVGAADNTANSATPKPTNNTAHAATPKPTGNTSNAATPKPTGNTAHAATPKPTGNSTATNEEGPYMGVVLMGFNAVKMSPFAYRSNRGTQQEASWWHYPSVYDTTNAKSKRGTKYFTLVCSPAEKVKSDVFKAATAAGKFPVILDLSVNKNGLDNIDRKPKGRAKNLEWSMEHVNNGPTTKIYFDLWMWDFYKMNASLSDEEKISDHIGADIKAIADEFKKKNPKVEVYVGGIHPYADSYPRADKTLYPENTYTYEEHQIKEEHDGNTPAKHKIFNGYMRDFCKQNGYRFVDYYASAAGLTGSNGWAKEEYMEAHGAMLNQAGLKKYADYLMSQMGLPLAKQDY